MLQIAFRNFRRAALTGTLALAAGSSASAGWLCGWCGQAERPWYNPCNEPNWGVQETQWRRFPNSGYPGGMQGSYCATGGCPAPGAPLAAPMQNGVPQPIAPGHAVPEPALQRMIIPSQPGHTVTPVLPPAGHSGTAPVFSAPSQAVPLPMNGGTGPQATPSSQFPGQLFEPHDFVPIPDNNVPPASGQPRVMAPAPTPMSGGMGTGTGTGGNGYTGGSGAGAGGGLVPMPDNMLPPRPQGSPAGPGGTSGGSSNGNGGGNGVGNGVGNPIPPMDNSLPPMPQAGYYQSPFSTAGYGSVQYGTPPPAQRQYGTPPAGQTSYSLPAAGQMSYGTAPSGQTQYTAPPASQMPYGAVPSGQLPVGGAVPSGQLPAGAGVSQAWAAQNQTLPGYPAQNYPVAAQQMPTSGQYQQNMLPQNVMPPAHPSPRLPLQGVSYSAAGGESATPSRNPFKMMSRLWSRKK